IARIMDRYMPEYSPRQAQLALADNLRAVVAQVLLAKTGGGRVPAREILMRTDAVARLIAERKSDQLAAAIEAGREDGMKPFSGALYSASAKFGTPRSVTASSRSYICIVATTVPPASLTSAAQRASVCPVLRTSSASSTRFPLISRA